MSRDERCSLRRKPVLRTRTDIAMFGLAIGLVATAVRAHGLDAGAPIWNFDPWIVGPWLLSATLYAAGLNALWSHAGFGRGVRARQAAWFVAGWLMLALALISPLDHAASERFSVHMVQHELLMAVAAPLLVLGRPLAVWAWAVPASMRARLVTVTRNGATRSVWALLTRPLSVWTLHALAIWVWHAPALFDAALRSTSLHTLQHFTFIGTALLFWWVALRAGSAPARGMSVLYLFTTMLHTGFLGALLTFSNRVWYASYDAASPAGGIDPLLDQQFGGLVMWIPGGFVYLIAGVLLTARWVSPYLPRRV